MYRAVQFVTSLLRSNDVEIVSVWISHFPWEVRFGLEVHENDYRMISKLNIVWYIR